MAKSQDSFNKKEREKKRQKKKKEKAERKEQRRLDALDGKKTTEEFMYVDEFGNLTPTPPDPNRKSKIKQEDIEVSVPKQEKVAHDFVRTGVVKFFNSEKGYGFIKDKMGNSIFVHVSGLVDQVREGDKVTFETAMGPKGMNAVEVKLKEK